jgi:hypothetical protein
LQLSARTIKAWNSPLLRERFMSVASQGFQFKLEDRNIGHSQEEAT